MRAINFNGFGVFSDELQQLVCLPPKILGAPTYLTSTQTSIEVGWAPPEFDGGCPIYTYELWRDDADGLTPYILIDDIAIRGKPYLTSFNVIGLTELGDAY